MATAEPIREFYRAGIPAAGRSAPQTRRAGEMDPKRLRRHFPRAPLLPSIRPAAHQRTRCARCNPPDKDTTEGERSKNEPEPRKRLCSGFSADEADVQGVCRPLPGSRFAVRAGRLERRHRPLTHRAEKAFRSPHGT